MYEVMSYLLGNYKGAKGVPLSVNHDWSILFNPRTTGGYLRVCFLNLIAILAQETTCSILVLILFLRLSIQRIYRCLHKLRYVLALACEQRAHILEYRINC